MKVLFVINAFDAASGAEHVLVDYLKTEKRIEPLFFIVGSQNTVTESFLQVTNKENIIFAHFKSGIGSRLSRFFLYRFYRFGLCQRLKLSPAYRELNKRNDIELVYYNNSFEASVFYPLFPDKKKIVHIHDMIDMFRPAQKKCVVSVCRKSPRILTASGACKEMLVANGICQDKIMVAYNAIVMEPEPYIEKQNRKELVIGFVGSAIHRKGFDIFVSIANAIQDVIASAGTRYRTISVIIITNSSERTAFLCENVSRLNSNIEKRVYCKIERDKVLALYKDMDLLLVPSRFDPLPTVVLEAYIKGVPVIGTAKDGMLEMQVSNTMMFRKEDVDEAVSTIIRWLNLSSEEKSILVKKTQHHIMQNFTEQKKREIVYDAMQQARGLK